MSPVTRSGRSVKASSTKDKLDDGVNNLSPELPTEAVNQLPSSTSVTLESLLTRALGGAKELERENNTLRKKVKLLESRLDRVEQDVPPQSQPRRATRATATTTQLKSEVTQLKKQVKRLEKSAEKYRKRVHQLSMRELKTEADELLETAEFEVGDSAHKMRKLLRRFHDLMLENSLDENEECLICFEALLPKKTRSLPCQHTFCDGCISKLKPEPDEDESIRCPQCRMLCLRDEAELIEFTASEQWDALLDVARQWARMDVRREDDTTEEEDAEEFLDDGVEESRLAYRQQYYAE
ncbi:hypothetical protein C8Q79DRAFT_900102 [Trametes meyenii]|nr:hypothetical protein C8Q79DRAFT_900102 [Trametes meyenii]